MVYPADRLNLPDASGSNTLSVLFGGTIAHTDGLNLLIDHIQGLEDASGIDAADGSQLSYLRLVDGAGAGKNEEHTRLNLLLNASFRIWQRGTSFTADGAYTADRWRTSFGTGGSPAYTVSRQAHGLADLPGEPQYFLRFNQTAQATTTPPTAEQRIEGVRASANKKLTISFWGRCSTGTVVVTPRAIQSFGTGGSPSSAVNTDGSTITLTTSWTRFSRTITVPSIAGKTVGTNGDDYLSIMLRCPTSATFQVDISQIKAEMGATASAFQDLPIGLDSRLCRRYYRTFGGLTTNEPGLIGYLYATNGILTALPLAPEMRATPTLTISAAADWTIQYGALSSVVCNAVGLEATTASPQVISINATCATTPFTAGQAARLIANSTNARINLSAEL